MEALYGIMEALLPFRWAQYDFMKNALLAVLMIAPVYALFGTMVVNNNMAFFSDALGHSALTGVAIGIVFGMKNTLVATVIFAVFFAVLINEVRHRGTASSDTIIGVFSSAAMALGLALLAYGGNFSKYSSYLIGDVLTVEAGEIAVLFILLLVISAVWIYIFNPLLVISVNPSIAVSRKINIRLYENIFLIMLAVLVTVSINKVGLLIINSMLVLPAATSRNMAKNAKTYTVFAVLIAITASVAGLIGAFYFNTSVGAAIILIMSLMFFISLLFARK